MPSHEDTFNLLHAPWIPVLYHDGTFARKGILTVLADAHRIRTIAASNPMDRVAILRFLLALLYWSRGNPPPKTPAVFPDEWFVQLRDNENLFDLFGDQPRFYQTPDVKRYRPATDLLQEIPTGNNFAHFAHVVDHSVGLCPPCCAMGLLRLPLFATSGTGGVRAGINGTPPFYVLPVGANLAMTLTRSWATSDSLGQPSWVEPVYVVPQDERVPTLVGLTALARRVWLSTDGATVGTCIGCGAIEHVLITGCEFEGAADMTTKGWHDPHTVHDPKSDKTTTPPNPMNAGRFQLDRPWTSLCGRAVAAGMFESETEEAAYMVCAYATNKALGVDTHERLIVGRVGDAGPAEVSERLQTWDDQGRRIGRQVARGGITGPSVIASIRPHIEHVVSRRTRDLLKPDTDAWKQAADEYGPFMRAVAESAAPGATVYATERRRRIMAVRPRIAEARSPASAHEETEDGNPD